MTEQATAVAAESTRRDESRYLVFGLAGEEYGIEILKVREIVGMMDITAVPRTPDFISGIINLRGKVVPVMDLRAKLGMPPAERTPDTCIIVVHLDGTEIGIVVDRVPEVVDIPSDTTEDTPSFGVTIDTSFILGVGRTGERVVLLLDIAKVLTSEEIDIATAI
jgi:purine-binding chemotaxis protein CheW